METVKPARSSTLVTAAQVLAPHSPYRDCELWHGIPVVREPQSPWPSCVEAEILTALTNHVKPRGLGMVLSGDAGYLLEEDPDLMLAADATFITPEKVARIPPHGFAPFAPDLVFEVRSPGDSWSEVLIKCGVWLSHGVRFVAAVNTAGRFVVVKRPGEEPEELWSGGIICCRPVLPDFSIPVDQIFDGLPPPS